MADFKRGAAGVNTVEGNVAGVRAGRLAKQREKEEAEYEAKKRKIQDDYARGSLSINDKFGGSATDQFEAMFKAQTVGLVTADEFRKAREAAEAGAEEAKATATVPSKAGGDKQKKKRKKATGATLSFGEELGDDADGGGGSSAGAASSSSASGAGASSILPKKVGKDPRADTSFLPDRERQERVRLEKERLRREWLEEQERIKLEKLEVTYSYWDGSGHRRVITITKGTTVGKFLSHVQQQISQDFHELRAVSSDNLLYIKEDLIIPHHYSFYDMIVTKARGKSGPLFHFDVHDDVRVIHDATVEKDESHPGKVVERRWYERSKHIFPASRWEVYDSNKDYGGYTVHGSEVN